MAAEQRSTPRYDLGPAQPIEHLYFFHGWTLTPDNPSLYQNTASWARKGFGIETTVAALPDTDTPDREVWQDHIKKTVTDPATSLIVSHSLAGINTLRYISDSKLEDPGYQLAGWIPLAVNLQPSGFNEIAKHFDGSHPDPQTGEQFVHNEFGVFMTRALLASMALRQVAVLNGMHDPYVYPGNGMLLAEVLDAPLYIDPNEAHFSGEYHDEQSGVHIAPCTFNLYLAFLISKMIMNVAPEGRYDISEGHTISVDEPLMHGAKHPFPLSAAEFRGNPLGRS
ncbi:MAG TPA: hypothetical protein VD735_06075 [Candidatus Saccharimonadales bacterium]|nr:hypothetical protein [Candidatus Saccharimonadales bacterium]